MESTIAEEITGKQQSVGTVGQGGDNSLSSLQHHIVLLIMDHQVADEDDIFVYTGGRAPQHIINAIVDRSISAIDDYAFHSCPHLLSVEFHDGITSVGSFSFSNCPSLRRLNLPSVLIVKQEAFSNCTGLTDVEFGNKLQLIELNAFFYCTSLRRVIMPSIVVMQPGVFSDCTALPDMELPENIMAIGIGAFVNCHSLRRITMPLNDDMIKRHAFNRCENLVTVNLIGGIHRTVSYLNLESWRNEMNGHINRINQVLPGIGRMDKTAAVQVWIESVLERLDHFKDEHYKLVSEAMALIELALWQAKMDNKIEEDPTQERVAKRVKTDHDSGEERGRQEQRIKCGANVVVKNVLPFLGLDLDWQRS